MIKRRRIAEHFAWSPQGTFLHMPLLELDDDLRVVSISEHGDAFTESAGVEFFNGLIVPGFVGCFPANPIDDIAAIMRMVRNGMLYVRCRKGEIPKNSLGYPLFIHDDCLPDCNIISQYVWDDLQATLRIGGQIDVAEWLSQHLDTPWRETDCCEGGSFLPSRRPGVLQMTGIDWKNMRFTPSATLKIIL